jgi:hypothetical protein
LQKNLHKLFGPFFRGFPTAKNGLSSAGWFAERKETNSSSLSSLANHLRSLPVIAHGDEGAMTQVPGVRPFYKSDLAYQLWVDPAALLHFLSG